MPVRTGEQTLEEAVMSLSAASFQVDRETTASLPPGCPHAEGQPYPPPTWRSFAAVAHAAVGARQDGWDLAQQEADLAQRAGQPLAAILARITAGLILGDQRALEGLAVNLRELHRIAGCVPSARCPVPPGVGQPGKPENTLTASALEHLDLWGRRMVSDLLRQLPANAQSGSVKASLTPHQQRLVSRALVGRTNGEIATEFSISRRAVEFHFTNIYRKLGISHRWQLHSTLVG